MRLSFFDTVKDPIPREEDISWTDITSKISSPEVRQIKDGKLFSPAVYSQPRRAKDNVTEISMLCLDFDGDMSFDDALEILADLELQSAIHTTWSHARVCDSNPEGRDRFRIMFPFEGPVTPEEFSKYWDWGSRVFLSKVDKSAKDTARIFYLPAVFEDSSPYRFRVLKGKLLSRAHMRPAPDDVYATYDEDEVHDKYAQAALEKEVVRVAQSSVGERHNNLNRAAFSLGTLIGAGVLTEAEVSIQLEDAALKNGTPHKEARRVIRDGIRAGLKTPRTLPAKDKSPTWEEPPVFEAKNTSEFPVEAFPLWVREFITGVARETQTPVEVSAVFCLGAIAGIVAPQVRVRVRGNWHENLNLYLLAALPPGHRKSAVHDFVLKPISDLEEKIQNDEKRSHVLEQAERDATTSQYNFLKRTVGNLTGLQFAQTSDRLKELAEKLENWPEPRLTRLICDDVTPEVLGTLLHEHNGAMMVLSAEGELFSIMSGRYSNGAVNYGVFLKGHNGDPLRIDRRGRTEVIRSPKLTLALAVQPDVLRAAAARTEFRDRGMLARFIYTVSDAPLGFREITPEPVSVSVLKAWANGIKNIFEAKKMPELRLSDEAAIVFRDWQAEVEKMLRTDGRMAEIVDWGAKLAGHTARIAALLHVAANQDRLDPWPDVIERESVEKAVSMARCFITHTLRVADMIEDDELVRHARRIILYIKTRNLRAFTVRQIARAQGPRLRKIRHLRAIFDFLCEQGWFRFEPRTGIYEAHQNIFNLSDLSDPVGSVSDPEKHDLSPEESDTSLPGVGLSDPLAHHEPKGSNPKQMLKGSGKMGVGGSDNPTPGSEMSEGAGDNPAFSGSDTDPTDPTPSMADLERAKEAERVSYDSIKAVADRLTELRKRVPGAWVTALWMDQSEEEICYYASLGDLEQTVRAANQYRMQIEDYCRREEEQYKKQSNS